MFESFKWLKLESTGPDNGLKTCAPVMKIKNLMLWKIKECQCFKMMQLVYFSLDTSNMQKFTG